MKLDREVEMALRRLLETAAGRHLQKGRVRLEMDDEEYDRMRRALGKEWEWQGLVRVEVGAIR